MAAATSSSTTTTSSSTMGITTTTTTTTTTVATMTSPQPPPIPNSYWATEYLCASEYPYSPIHPVPQLDKLLKAGIRTFIDLTEPGELLPYDHLLRARARAVGIPDSEPIFYHRFPIRDRCIPPKDSPIMKEIMSVLEECELAQRKADVHCRGGIGRTGTVVGCWLVQSGRVPDGDGALLMIKGLWKRVAKCKKYPESPETGQQCEFVRRFAGVILKQGVAAARSTATRKQQLGVHVQGGRTITVE